MIKIKDKKYVTPKELAEIKGVKVQTIYNHIKSGIYNTRKLMDKTLIEV